MKFFGLDIFTAIHVIGYLILLGLGAYFVINYLNQDLLSMAPTLVAGIYACFIPAYDFWSAAAIKAARVYGYPGDRVMWYADGFCQLVIMLGIVVGGYGLIYFIKWGEG